MRQLLAFMADEVGDVMYYHQAMNQPTWGFTQVLVMEVNAHVENEDWELISCNKVTEGVVPLLSTR